MAKEKVSFSSKIKSEKKPVKSRAKKPNKGKKESINDYDVDSLDYLRDKKRSKDLDGIDEKIKLLRTELKSLLNDKIIGNNYENSKDATNISCNNNSQNLYGLNKTNLVAIEADSMDVEEKDSLHLENKQKIFEPSNCSTPTKFSEWLKDSGDEEIVIKTQEGKPSNAQTLSLNPKPQMNIIGQSAPNARYSVFDVSSLPQEKVELLLYKSFIMQKFGSLSEKNYSVYQKSSVKTNKKTLQRPKKNITDKNKKYTQQTLKKYCSSTQRGRKRRKRGSNSTDSDVEVVNLDSSKSSIATIHDTISLDSDIIDCNWNEPFDVDELPSVVEIRESSEEKKTDVNQEVLFSDTDLMEAELTFLNDEHEKTLMKGVWECPVCFEKSKGQEVVATQCGHIFCKKCLENHFSKLNKNCPSCRANLENKPLITLFNL